jgi:uncharacterized RDD family membrane protein YckC
MTDSYYLLRNEEQTGPFTWYELTEQGLDVDTMLMPVTSNKWQRASDLPEFYEYFEAQGIYFPTEDNLATFGWRLIAFIVDWFVIAILLNIAAPFIAPYVNIDLKKITIETIIKLDQHTQLLISLGTFTMFTIYNTLFEISPFQGSIGKRLCKIIVVDEDGRKLGFVRAFLRNLYKFISEKALFIGYLAVFWNEHRQAWHDQWARTYLIRRDQ